MKVLKSGSKSKIFVYLSNLGATGLLAFPNFDFMYADELIKVFKTMQEKKLYGEMVVYVEGSEAATVFKGLLPGDGMNILVLAATDSMENSFATYCYPNDMVMGKHIGTCLGDVFTANFIEDTMSSDPKKETL